MLAGLGFALVIAAAGIALFHPEFKPRAVTASSGCLAAGTVLLMIWRFG